MKNNNKKSQRKTTTENHNEKHSPRRDIVTQVMTTMFVEKWHINWEARRFPTN